MLTGYEAELHSRALEARVGAALFIRTTRSVGLTEAGERFLLRAKPAFEELVAASGDARDLGQRPAGLLRLTAPRAVVPIRIRRSNGSIAPWSFVDGNKTVEAIVSGPLIANDFPTMSLRGFDNYRCQFVDF
jgi:hypothetical protein